MKPLLTFTCEANPYSTWRVRVVLWKTRTNLVNHRRAPRDKDHQPVAFVDSYDYGLAFESKDSVFCEVHLSLTDLLHAYLVHECYHVLMNYALLTRLKLHGSGYTGEEWAAETVEHTYRGVADGLRSHGYRLRV